MKKLLALFLALAAAGATLSLSSCDPTEEQKLQIIAASFACGQQAMVAAKPCAEDCVEKFKDNAKACALGCLEAELTKALPTCGEEFAKLKGEEFARTVRLVADSLVNLWEVLKPKPAAPAAPAPTAAPAVPAPEPSAASPAPTPAPAPNG